MYLFMNKLQFLNLKMDVSESALEAGFLWRVRVLQGPATRHETFASVLSVVQVSLANPSEYRYGTRTLVRLGDLRKKKVKWKRAEGVEGPSPGAVWCGNGRALMGPKGPYLLPGEA